jgi:nucleoside-diphosphate-sugar epimerase
MMTGRTVLVTGAAGFVGSHLVDELLRLENTVVGFDIANLDQARNLDLAKTKSNFKYIQGDIRNKVDLERCFQSKIQNIFHLASVVGVHKYIDDPFGLIDITIGGTRNIAELALKTNTPILYTSTSEVFGKNPKVPWSEDDDRVLGNTQVDRWSYSSSKAVCEHMLLALYKQKKVPVNVVRYFNVYGPRQSPIFVVSQSVHKVLNNQKPLLYDDGQQTRCFTYVEDAVRGTIMAASNSKALGEVINIGNNTEITMKEAVELVIKFSGKNITWEKLDTKEHYGKTYEDIPRRVPAVSKAKRLLDWEVTTSHPEGIRKTVEWASQNSWWLKPL